jgi:hypothetical protein
MHDQDEMNIRLVQDLVSSRNDDSEKNGTSENRRKGNRTQVIQNIRDLEEEAFRRAWEASAARKPIPLSNDDEDWNEDNE